MKQFSLRLDELSKMYEQPWVIIDENDSFIKIIFQEHGILLISKDGDVSYGQWELIHRAQSLLLDIGGQKKMYNHLFIDKGLMLLKLDGYSERILVLVNQNIVPDLDVENYLKRTFDSQKNEVVKKKRVNKNPNDLSLNEKIQKIRKSK